LGEVDICAGYKVLMEADDSIFPIVGNPCGIFDELLKPHPIFFLNVIGVSNN
jgi:hypothetical protein